MPAKVAQISLTSGEKVDVSDHLTVVVGPNNVGKSVLLSSMWAHLNHSLGQQGPMPPTAVVASLDLLLPSRDELRERLLELYEERGPDGTYYEPHYLNPQLGVIPHSQIEVLYAQGLRGPHLGSYANVAAAYLQPETRLGQLGNATVPNLYTETVQTPLQRVWANREAEARIEALAQRAFGINLTVNRHGGSQIGLHVGSPVSPEPRIGEVTPYLDEVANLPLANAQGHGVQSFLGILLTLVSRQFDIVIVDEPEAFLHPPQARLLGEVFVEFARMGTQIVASTHSDDFLRGALTASSSSAEVTIARLTRPNPTENAVAQLEAKAVRELFEDPLLRYSNILGGIFYKGVVLCESEADCKYYAAVLDHLFTDEDAGKPRPDLLFTQCGGKDRLAKGASALMATRVPTAVIADIDLLADRGKFEELFRVLGGVPETLVALLNTVEAAVASQATRSERSYVQYKYAEILASSDAPHLGSPEVRELRELLKTRTGWELAKKKGRGALPNGGVVAAFNSVLAAAATVGLFILPIGELESFHPAVEGNKQAWLRQVFEQELFRSSPDAVILLGQVVGFVAGRQ